jgi:hypothetical protein
LLSLIRQVQIKSTRRMLFRKLLLTVLQLICLLKTQGYYSVVPTFRSSSFSSRVIRNDLKFSVYTKTRLLATQTPELSLGAGGINNLPPFFPNDDKASTIESISDILPSTNRHKTAWLTSSVAFALAFLFPTPVKALVLKTYKSLTPFQKIATIPVFYICDRHGNAYFQHNTNVSYLFFQVLPLKFCILLNRTQASLQVF